MIADILIQIAIPCSMFLLMLGMGITLTVSDFRRVLLVPKPVIIGLVVQLLLMPAIGFGLALGFGLSAMLAAGLIAVAACPGGTASNVFAHVGKGDAALSITLTATATFATLFTLPLWMNYSLAHFGESQTHIVMPILDTAIQLGAFTVLPVVIGMWVRHMWPASLGWEKLLTKVSVVTMFLSFLLMGILDEDDAFSHVGQVFTPTVLFFVIAIALGFSVPRFLGVSTKASVTIAVEVCVKNILLSLFLATSSLKSVDASLASVVASVVIVPGGFLIMFLYRLWSSEEEGEGASRVSS
ncbi:bile acid:sodium symporter family protein [Maricurvus nonylphenolicus]|uniref:bile acid:sodium symporter family protein n=1 Tax=Maricurvus nonylphenolicus TaxID=1008307 RepID=UPI0036F2393F